MDALHLVVKRFEPERAIVRKYDIDAEDFDIVEAVATERAAKTTRVMKSLSLGASRIGGLPDLPAELTWPEFDRRKLPFIAQIDLAATGRASKWPLPKTGYLFFFALLSDVRDDGRMPSSVIYFRGPTASLVRQTAPDEASIWPDWNGIRQYDPYAVERCVRRANGLKRVETVAGALPGRPDVEPDLPGDVADLALKNGTDWIQFFTVRGLGNMEWGDEGHLIFVARKGDLADEHFEDTLVTIDGG